MLDVIDNQKGAEPVVASRLRKWEVYFMLTYFDKQALVPEMKALVYLGRDVARQNDDLLYFQDMESYAASGAYSPDKEGTGDLYICADAQLNDIFTLEAAGSEIMHCLSRRSTRATGVYDFDL